MFQQAFGSQGTAVPSPSSVRGHLILALRSQAGSSLPVCKALAKDDETFNAHHTTDVRVLPPFPCQAYSEKHGQRERAPLG